MLLSELVQVGALARSLCTSKAWITGCSQSGQIAAIVPPRKIGQKYEIFNFFQPMEKHALKWPEKGSEVFFLTYLDLADILGRKVNYSIRFAQSAGPVFYRFGSLFESIVTP